MASTTNIKIAALAKGLRLLEVAERCGLHPSALSEIIAGRRVASPKLRARLARVLRCDQSWLFAEPEVPAKGARGEVARVRKLVDGLQKINEELCMVASAAPDGFKKL